MECSLESTVDTFLSWSFSLVYFYSAVLLEGLYIVIVFYAVFARKVLYK